MKVFCVILTVILFFNSAQGETPVNENGQSETSPREQKRVLGFLTNNIAHSQLLREKIDEAKKKIPLLTASINNHLGGDVLEISNDALKFNRSALLQALRPQKTEVGNVAEDINLEEHKSVESLFPIDANDDNTADAVEEKENRPQSEKDSLIVSIAKELGEIESDVEVLPDARTLILINNWLLSLVLSIVKKVFYLVYITIVPFPLRWLIEVILYLLY